MTVVERPTVARITLHYLLVSDNGRMSLPLWFFTSHGLMNYSYLFLEMLKIHVCLLEKATTSSIELFTPNLMRTFCNILDWCCNYIKSYLWVLHKKWSFSLRISLINVTKADLVTFTKEIVYGKLHFFVQWELCILKRFGSNTGLLTVYSKNCWWQRFLRNFSKITWERSLISFDRLWRILKFSDNFMKYALITIYFW